MECRVTRAQGAAGAQGAQGVIVGANSAVLSPQARHGAQR